eukprot:CAMPEP_0197670396 /NCGR_PEP_ID=MMETSP1338-20131121/74457_1 /TAXON_ID=43686 ORGANISM="Pelagodinium beii, Strain RCC1491" /NCGR_SAMPLE_ID=MMETSP1338 /ASSEMBLY_ACC=CAM_ASM_000754 /LENGTH=74 /DNA_ID=CAMNT_0043250131 /DNA_START=1024 /DNA_END=1248 /DNA_ORIENTATION=-
MKADLLTPGLAALAVAAKVNTKATEPKRRALPSPSALAAGGGPANREPVEQLGRTMAHEPLPGRPTRLRGGAKE